MQKYLQSYWFLATVFLYLGLKNDWQWIYYKMIGAGETNT